MRWIVIGQAVVDTVGRIPRHIDLAADEAEPLFLELEGLLLDLLSVTSRGVGVDGCCLSDFSTKKLVDRHARQFAFDIPERHVDGGHGSGERAS